MKIRVVIGTWVVFVVLVTANLFPGHAQKVMSGPPTRQASSTQPSAPEGGPVLPPVLDEGTRFNPLKIALLKWFLFDSTAPVPVGTQPIGVCFDGANIWTANYGDSTVTKVRASDGQVLGTFNVGANPFGVTFDGANIWATVGTSMVAKLRASDGKLLGTFPTGNASEWMTFDGQNIWVANGGDNTVSKLRAADGKTLGTFPVGNAPFAMAFDGAAVWSANYGGGTVTKLRASDGKLLGSFRLGTGQRASPLTGQTCGLPTVIATRSPNFALAMGRCWGLSRPLGRLTGWRLTAHTSGCLEICTLRFCVQAMAQWWRHSNCRARALPSMGRTSGQRYREEIVCLGSKLRVSIAMISNRRNLSG
jgi:hypothetical protein